MAPVFFEFIRQMTGMFVMQGPRRFLDAGPRPQQFDRPALALLRQPRLGTAAHLFAKIPFQCPHGHTAVPGQVRSGGVHLLREFRPLDPPELDPAAWRYDLDEVVDQLTAACRAVDPTSTDHVLETVEEQVEEEEKFGAGIFD